jgi:predicted N-acetyltransferase YhbS
MGKIFPTIKNLKEKPSCFQKTLQLIEKSFKYRAPHSFQIDFAPLIDVSNHHNCFILIDENDEVLAHIGVKERKIKFKEQNFSICMLGGIAVDEKHRGHGYFNQLLTEIISEKRSETCFFILWSDQESLYKKHGFSLCGGQYEVSVKNKNHSLEKTNFSEISPSQFEDIKKLFQTSYAQNYLTVERSDEDWSLIKKITSADLYIQKENNKVVRYFVMNKGEDLEGIVYEYAGEEKIQDLLELGRGLGKLWMGHPFIDAEVEQYQFMLAPGDLKLFSDFILVYTSGLMTVKNINIIKQEIFFEFNQETLLLSIEEFLRGIFGPAPFEELGEVRPFFISGLDSI